ncbi:MAG: BrnT family toxin [Euryarchaeota archaeon]|nr:BrnT family toxin [Euryarchaeota archaeon]
MRFEWDPKKAKRNLRKHAVSFDEAVTVFYDSLSATFDDPDHSVGEHRYITIGFSSRNRLLVVGYTERGEILRIINARPATAHERKRHEGQT